ncbi:MAG: hypothetical protein GF390_02990 [Candidatus Pacebacteria bacterium]|nr:hypothetical protein [Candidatus Paceibacterota bacterium]
MKKLLEDRLINQFHHWQKSHQLKAVPALSLVSSHPDVFWTFTPSYGATFYIDLIKNNQLQPDQKHISAATVQPCLRLLDSPNKLRKNCSHLSLFQMASYDEVFPNNIDHTQAKMQALKKWWQYVKNLEIEQFLKKLHVIICEAGPYHGLTLSRDQVSLNFWQQIGIPKKNIHLKPPTRLETVFFSRAEPLGGQMTEIFFQIEGKLVEIGMFADFAYDRRFKKSGKFAIADTKKQLSHPGFCNQIELLPNKRNIFSAAFGVERLALLLDQHQQVYDLPSMKPLAKILRAALDNKNLNQQQQLLFYQVVDLIRPAVFIAAEGLSPTGSNNHGRSQIFRRKILTKIAQNLVCLDLFEQELLTKLIQQVIEIHSQNYPDLLEDQAQTHKIILDKLTELHHKFTTCS